MAENFFSDHFNSNAVPGVATLTGSLPLDGQKRTSAGLSHSRLRRKQARMTVGTGVVIGSELRMLQMRSSDRLFDLKLTTDGGATAGSANLGLYKTGLAHDGAVIDADLFGSLLLLSTAIVRADELKESATLEEADRGKRLWEMADEGGGTFTADPLEDWDLVLTATIAFTVALMEIQLEVDYTSGD